MVLKKWGNTILGAVFIVFAVVLYAGASKLPPNLMGGIGSDFFPKIIAIGMGILGVLQCVSGIRSVKEEPEKEAAPEEDRPEYIRVLATAIAFGVYVFSIKTVGFLICSVIYLFIQMIILAPKEKRNFVLFAIISVVFNVAVYFIFRNGLNVMLPTGFLG